MNDLLEPVLGAERWPPMLGVVGFDGGYKSSVALAIPPEGLVAGEGEFRPAGAGACCNADNSCTDGLTQFDCTSSGGTYQGDGTDCASVDCGGVTGACCIDGVCSILSESDCFAFCGMYQGDGTICETSPCGGACCMFDGIDFTGVCNMVSDSAACILLGGIYQGDGTLCVYVNGVYSCLGACCEGDDSCNLATGFNCSTGGGGFQAYQTICSNCLDPLGSCGGGSVTGCEYVTESECDDLGGTLWSAFVPCAPTDCGGPSMFSDPFFQNN